MTDRLEYLLALARERHFGRAAASLGISQPTLSAGIKQLEESFDALLVARGSRFRGFTEAGEVVLEGARRVVADTRAIREDVAALRRSLSGQLRLASIPTALPLLPLLTAPFAARHPSVRLTCLSRTSDEVLALLENLEVEAGLTYVDQERLRRVVAVPLWTERFRYVCTVSDPRAGAAQIGWAELGDVRLCLLTPDMQNRRLIDRALAAAGVTPQVAVQSDSMLALLAHLRAGTGATILPESWVSALGLPDLRSVALLPELAGTVGLVVPEREPMGVLVQALLAEARRLDRLD